MNVTIIGLIVICIFGILFLVMNSQNKVKSSGKKSEEEALAKGEIRRKKDSDIPRKDITDFMEFDKILDNMIIQENGQKYTMVVQCKGINYDLMSQIEQLAVEEGFITFLNTLKFPVQLYVQARAIDLKKSMDSYKPNLDELTAQYNEAEDHLKTVSTSINSSYEDLREAKMEREKFANIVEYAEDITRYVERISLNKHVLQRKFYIIFSYYKSEITTTSDFTEQELHDLCYRELYTRAQTIISALMSCSVTGKVLTSNELAELLYISYNRDDEKLLDIKTALESGFYRLYSTSEDVFDKKQKLMQKEIDEEAARRVQVAINELIDADDIKTEEELREEFEERADMRAINLVREIGINEEIKEKLAEHIATNHVIEAEQRRQMRIARENNINAQERILTEEKDESLNLSRNELEDQAILEKTNIQSDDFIKKADRSDLEISDRIINNVNNVANHQLSSEKKVVQNSNSVQQSNVEKKVVPNTNTVQPNPSVSTNVNNQNKVQQPINNVKPIQEQVKTQEPLKTNVVNNVNTTTIKNVEFKSQVNTQPNVQKTVSNQTNTEVQKKPFPEPLTKMHKEEKVENKENTNDNIKQEDAKTTLNGENDSIV